MKRLNQAKKSAEFAAVYWYKNIWDKKDIQYDRSFEKWMIRIARNSIFKEYRWLYTIKWGKDAIDRHAYNESINYKKMVLKPGIEVRLDRGCNAICTTKPWFDKDTNEWSICVDADTGWFVNTSLYVKLNEIYKILSPISKLNNINNYNPLAYGFWVKSNGEIIEVEVEKHNLVALQHIRSPFSLGSIKAKQNGWISVRSNKKEINIETTKPTRDSIDSVNNLLKELKIYYPTANITISGRKGRVEKINQL